MTVDFAKEIIPITIEHELKQSYLAYAMSVIVGRALPDVRDGLKPVHRRILFAMHELGNDWNKAYKKSARIVGDVIGKYHPHGDSAVYDTIVRMAQNFSMRYMLVDGQGNFGSVDGDSAAAMRYTEIRMSKISHALLADLEKDTVEFAPNYDETEMIPLVLPTRVPNLLINGSSGIAVGMATNIPPHNLREVVDACIALIEDPSLAIDDLMQYLPGPDFPTQGIINGRAGIVQAYKTGRGSILVRARAHIEKDEKSNKDTIIVTELPYQVNKARLIERIAELVKDKLIEGISELRDESDKDGIRVVVELKRGESGEVVLNNLFNLTQMQTFFGINMVALVDNTPKLLNLKQVLEFFLMHRREVVLRRCRYELNQGRERAHLLEGLAIALTNIDEMVELIKKSSDPQTAKERMMSRAWKFEGIQAFLSVASKDSRPQGLSLEYGLRDEGYWLSPAQAQAILDLRLHRLTGLEQENLLKEYHHLLEVIRELMSILASQEKLMTVIRNELMDIKNEFGDARKTEILSRLDELTEEDLINREDMVVTLSHEGYAKIQPLSQYEAQHRGGRGKQATSVKESDFVDHLVIASTHDMLLCFSNFGRVYWLKVYQIPEAGRNAKGRPIVNILSLAEGEKISAITAISEFIKDRYVFMATEKGTVKKVPLEDFSRPRTSGIIAIDLAEEDRLIAVDITDGSQEIMLFTDVGKAIRFSEKNVRSMGRMARGVRGIELTDPSQRVIALLVLHEGDILTATEYGFGKRTTVDEYRLIGRGGQGVRSIQTNERNGNVVGALQVKEEDEFMMITDAGTLVRTRVGEVSVIGRNTQGVRLINVQENEKLVSVQRINAIELGPEDEGIQEETPLLITESDV